jgi:glycosyltransferase involved in cell wall biosynthesis
MFVAHVIASLDPRHGGPSRSVRALAEAQVAAGHDVELIAGGESATRLETGRLTVTTLPLAWPTRLGAIRGLVPHLAARKPEIVHEHGVWLRNLAQAHRGAVAVGAPLVISPRGMLSSWALRHHAWRKGLARRLLHPGALEAAAGWHATSEDEARDLARSGFLQPVCVAPNGVEVPSTESLAAARARWVELCPALEHRRTAVFYSRLHAKKRVLELIDLWLAVAPEDWLLLIVGIPEQYTVNQLQDYAYRAGGGGRVEVFDGAGLPAPYAAASLCLLPSHSENFGLVVAEALASGIPALVTDSTPWKLLAAARAGWCVPWADFGATLAEAVRESEPSLAARGANARAWARATFAWASSALALLEFYASLRRPEPRAA